MLRALEQILNSTWQWRWDGIAACVVVPALVVAAAAWLYAPAYLDQPRYRKESRRRFFLLFGLFVAGMLGAALAADLVLFLVCWEVMTLASYALVAFETEDAAALRAAFKYFVMTHVGTGCLLFAAVVLGVQGGSFSFQAAGATLGHLALHRPLLLQVVLALFFVGFATKAGLYPFGDWLPDAHPAAPAPVSAVLSGVMVKLGLYGLLRFFVAMLAVASPPSAATWGWVIGGFGLVSALIGGLAACAALDLKVLLAYSSIAQSGIIALGLGAALVLRVPAPPLAALALLAAVFHMVSDAPVKGLLFLNAGAVQWRTGSRLLQDLGGLFEAMPVTGGAALIGTLAIAGFPPFAAFTSKWLLLQATVLSKVAVLTLAGLGLLVASLLSALYAVKFFAGTFANRPMRAGALEAPRAMQWSQLALAAVVLALGLMPGALLAVLARALHGIPALAGIDGARFGAQLLPMSGAYAPLALIGIGAWAALAVRAAVGPVMAPARREPWAGGVTADRQPVIDPKGYYSPLRPAFEHAYHALHWPHLVVPAWVLGVTDFDRWLYVPGVAAGRRLAQRLRRLHAGVPQLYLAWQLLGAAAMALLLLFLSARRTL